jgi:hypothetical protein
MGVIMLAITAARTPITICVFLNLVQDCDEGKVAPTTIIWNEVAERLYDVLWYSLELPVMDT